MKKVLISVYLAAHISATQANETKCLAQMIYREARGEPEKGKLAVALVAINRTKDYRFPDTICKVVNQPGQYQWTKRYKTTLPDYESLMIAKRAISGEHNLLNFKALYFHNLHVKPNWKYKRVASIGNHIFYKA